MMTINKEKQKKGKLGLYIHLPFCQKKCTYCGFLSLENQPYPIISQYLRDVLSETDLRIAESFKEDASFDVDTVFIGGGTPSLIEAIDMSAFLKVIKNSWHVVEDAEITMESNPNSLTLDKLIGYRKAGINRLSIGVQSFDDQLLKQIGRLHDVDTAVNAVAMAREAGFENINLDLIFGLPVQTLVQWEQSLVQAVSLAPTHLSLYTLQIEEGTQLYRDYRAEKLPEIDITIDRACYHLAIQFLKEHGYEQYEISNFSKKGYECQHNMKYWSMENFIGLGLNASSFLDGFRWTNLSDLEQFHTSLAAERLPVNPDTVHLDTPTDAMGIFMFTGLRKTQGVSFDAFRTRFGVDFFQAYSENLECINHYRQTGLLNWTDTQNGHILITEKGIDQSNQIMSEFV
jgi:oxygen-independent coproporphyrinogen III oxidase